MAIPSPRGAVAWMTQHPVAANLLMAFLMIGGLILGRGIKQEVFPEFDADMIAITVPYPGASPAETEQGIVLALEEAVRSLEGVDKVYGTAAEGAGTVVIELTTGTDAIKALQDVKSQVDAITTFPEEAETAIVSLATRRHEVISVMVHGQVEAEALRQVAEDVRQGLLDLPGITYVEIKGAKDREIVVELSREAEQAHGLTMPALAQQLSAAAVELPGGGLKTQSGEVLVRVADRRSAGEDFAQLPVVGGDLKLSELATVVDGFAETDLELYFNGAPALKVDVYRSGDQTPAGVAAATRAYLARTAATLPPGVQATPIDDSSELLTSRMDLLKRNAYMGLVLVLAVLGLFLSPRLAFWVTMGIPISFLGSLILLPVLDLSINMVSLFAFIVTLGVVVDDAIVVGENIFELHEQGLGWTEAATEGARGIATPVTFSVLTTIAAFSPLLFIPGGMGSFFSAIPSVVIAVLTISLVESIFVLPAHLSHRDGGLGRFLTRLFGGIFSRRLRAEPLNAPARPRQGPPPRWLQRLDLPRVWMSAWLERVSAGVFSKSVRWALRYRYVSVALGVGLLLVSLAFVASGRLRFSPTPQVEGDRVTASLVMPYGTPVKETEQALKALLKAAHGALEASGGARVQDGVLSSLGMTLGRGAGHNSGQGASHLAGVRVYLVDSGERDFTTRDFVRRWRARLPPLAGLESLSFKSTVGPSSQPVAVELAHPDLERLAEASAQLADKLKGYAGVRDIDDGFAPGKPQIDLHLTPAGAALGLTSAALGSQLRGAFYGSEVLRQMRGRDEVKVVVRRPQAERVSELDWESFLVRTPSGGEVPLTEVAEVKRGRAYTVIDRVDGRRVVTVAADVDRGVGNAEEILASLEAEALPALMAEYPGLTYTLAGDKQDTEEAVAALQKGGIIALLVIFVLLSIPFGSYLQPLIVMSAIPFGVVGAIGGHLLLGYELSMVSLFGIVAVSGIVVNDSLVLVHAANERRDAGLPPEEAAHGAARRRLRPILLTSLTTFFGLAPMILETSVQARFLIPMAISLGFGVMFSTLITLVLVPALYLIVEDARAAVLGARVPPAPAEAPADAGTST